MTLSALLLLVLHTGVAAKTSRRLVNPRISGMQVEASQKLLTYGASIINQIIVQEIGKVSIPEISGEKDGFEYDVKNCHVTASISSPGASFSAASGLMIKLAGVNVHAKCDWKYKLHSWPHVPDGSGSLDASAGGGSHVNANLMPTITAADKLALAIHDVDIGLDDFSVSVHGSLFSWLYDLIVDAFKGSIKDSIVNAGKTALTSAVDNDLNKALAGMDLVVDLPFPAPFNTGEMDFTITGVEVSNDALTARCAASVNDTRHPTTNPYPGPAAAIAPTPPAVRDGTMFTLTLSTWPFNNALWVYSEAGALDYEVTGKMIPPSFPIQLNTTAFDAIIPGLAKAFPGAPLQILANVPRGFQDKTAITPTTTLEVNKLPILFNFTVINGSKAVPAFTLGCPLNLGAAIALDKTVTTAEKLLLNVTDIACSPITTQWSGYGPVDPSGINVIIDFVLSGQLVPYINKMLANGFALPSIDGVTFLNSVIQGADNTVRIGTDITWKPSMLDA